MGGGCEGQLHGGQGGQMPLSGSHAGHAQAQLLPPEPPELPAPEELPRVEPPPLHSLLPSGSVWQQPVSTPPPVPLLPAPFDEGGEYQPTGHA